LLSPPMALLELLIQSFKYPSVISLSIEVFKLPRSLQNN
jgi:hypothetical protein